MAGQDRLFVPPVQPGVRARALIVECEGLLALGRPDEALDAAIQELQALEARYGCPALYGASRWLDRLDCVVIAAKELDGDEAR